VHNLNFIFLLLPVPEGYSMRKELHKFVEIEVCKHFAVFFQKNDLNHMFTFLVIFNVSAIDFCECQNLFLLLYHNH